MLRQVLIVKDNNFLYQKTFAKAINNEEFNNLFNNIKKMAFSGLKSEIGSYDYFQYRISYVLEKDLKIFFIFVTGLDDDFKRIKSELARLKKEFINLFKNVLKELNDLSVINVIDPIIDSIHRNLKPKISLVGFSGVGKTTITKLIRKEEIPLEHIPTITGEVSAIQIGKLVFYLWDFAGQEQFSFLWNNFIEESDAVLLITDSTLENIEKSKFFIDLIQSQAPNAHCAVIANKRDLENALSVERIQEILGLKTYAMIAIDPNNRDKMIQIIADILEINSEVSPLLKPLFERAQLMKNAQRCLEDGDFDQVVNYYEKIFDICVELGDDKLGKEYYEKAQKIKKILNG